MNTPVSVLTPLKFVSPSSVSSSWDTMVEITMIEIRWYYFAHHCILSISYLEEPSEELLNEWMNEPMSLSSKAGCQDTVWENLFFPVHPQTTVPPCDSLLSFHSHFPLLNERRYNSVANFALCYRKSEITLISWSKRKSFLIGFVIKLNSRTLHRSLSSNEYATGIWPFNILLQYSLCPYPHFYFPPECST